MFPALLFALLLEYATTGGNNVLLFVLELALGSSITAAPSSPRSSGIVWSVGTWRVGDLGTWRRRTDLGETTADDWLTLSSTSALLDCCELPAGRVS